MSYYQELKLLPEDENDLYFLWSKVFQQIHIGLAEMKNDQGFVPIGISFPKYSAAGKHITLGDKLRLFAQDEITLSQFNITKWLSYLTDYVHYTGIRPVPAKLQGYAIYQREQPKLNKERLARRYAARHNIDFEQALVRYREMIPKPTRMPFIRLKSLSNYNVFYLWIKKIPVNKPGDIRYSTYGLSTISSVPEF